MDLAMPTINFCIVVTIIFTMQNDRTALLDGSTFSPIFGIVHLVIYNQLKVAPCFAAGLSRSARLCDLGKRLRSI